MNLCRTIFYRPEPERPDLQHGEDCGDFMPFYWGGTYYLFYLHKYCVYVVETKDFVHFSEPRLALPSGTPDEQDWHVGTGSVFYSDGVFYFYYTGFNEGNRTKLGKYEQVILRATSNDLKTWVKDRSFALYPDERYYEGLHWRDPQIFWNKDLGKYCMAITATEKGGYRNRNGCSVIMVSDDCINWKHYKTIYSPRIFATHECHDLFQIGDWWYMVFSTYTRWWETRYRMSKSFDGPWLTPEKDDMFDGRTLYAAKTVSNGERRFIVGWQSARKGMDDNNKNVWGGSLLVHELVQRKDGTLGVKPVKEIEEFFCAEKPLSPIIGQGNWCIGETFTSTDEVGFSWLKLGELSELCMVRTTVEWDENASACGFMLHTEGEFLDKWAQVRLEIKHGKIIVDRYNRFDGDQSFIDERPIHLTSNRAEIKVIMSGNIILTYINDTAIAVRSYSTGIGGFGVFSENGAVKFIDTKLLVGSDQ